MLKLLSKSLEAYQRFIFKFKIFALNEYAQACFDGKEPFNTAVAQQIYLAIENNLKILNIPGLFSDIEIKEQIRELEALQKKLNEATKVANNITPAIQEQIHTYTATGEPLQATKVQLDDPVYANAIPPLTDFNDGTNLLANMSKAISNIEKLSDPADQYVYLEHLLLQLPLNPSFLKSDGFYRELKTMDDFEKFKKNLAKMQQSLLKLREKCLKEEQTPAMNMLILSLVSLHIDANTIISKDSKAPSFLPFTSAMMETIIGNLERNPYVGTNHPVLDQRLIDLQKRYYSSPAQYLNNYYQFFKDLLQTESGLNDELIALYQKEFGKETIELHDEIRKNGLEAVYMIAGHLNNKKSLDNKFNPIIQKVQRHLDYETLLRHAINPFFVNKYGENFSVAVSHNSFRINSSLFPAFLSDEQLETGLSASKYTMKESPARDSLDEDHSESSVYSQKIRPKTANGIQLNPGKRKAGSESGQKVTQADITARDYLHLRSEPSLQIALTLDYFTRNIKKLADESDQRYVEANLFQTGLLLDSAKDPEFIPQFDKFLETGQCYFTNSGQHTKNSLIYVRLDYLVSRYLVLNKDPVGLTRLKNLQGELEKQLSTPNNPDVTYVLQQYLFLNLMTRMDAGEYSEELFNLAYKSYSYINSHTNPAILEDRDDRLAVDIAKAKFKMLARKQSNDLIRRSVKQSLLAYEQETKQDLEISGSFPIYKLVNRSNNAQYQFNALLGKLFEKKLARGGVPLAIQNHPLIKHLGLNHIRECFATADESYLVLSDKDTEVRLFYKDNKLTVQKDWTIQKKKGSYELQALTDDHLAKHAHANITVIEKSLPKVLTDGSMDYWRNTANSNEGLLVQNNVPKYSIRAGKLWPLDSNGREIGYHLTALGASPIKKFESNEFVLAYSSPSES